MLTSIWKTLRFQTSFAITRLELLNTTSSHSFLWTCTRSLARLQIFTFYSLRICRRLNVFRLQVASQSCHFHLVLLSSSPCSKMLLKTSRDINQITRKIRKSHWFTILQPKNLSQKNGKIWSQVWSWKYWRMNSSQQIYYFYRAQTMQEVFLWRQRI